MGGRLLGVVVGAEAELEEAHVVGGQLHAHLDHLVLLILPSDDALAVHAAGLVRPRLQRNNDMIFLFMKGDQEKAIKLRKKYELLISKLRLMV